MNVFCRHSFGKTYDVVLGAGQMVQGMEVGLKDMCVGEKRILVIPPHLGYGERGVGEDPHLCACLITLQKVFESCNET